MAKTKACRPAPMADRINALAVGQSVGAGGMRLDRFRAAAAIVSRNTGRQFTIDTTGRAPVITRRG